MKDNSFILKLTLILKNMSILKEINATVRTLKESRTSVRYKPNGSNPSSANSKKGGKAK